MAYTVGWDCILDLSIWTILVNTNSRSKLERVFCERLSRACPEFVFDPKSVVPKGGSVYRWDASTAETFFIVLVAWSGDEKFTIECAYSSGGLLPPRLKPRPQSSNQSLSQDGGFRLRLGKLTGSGDLWWRIAPASPRVLGLSDPQICSGTLDQQPASLNSIQNVVDDALESITQHWIPICRELVSRTSK